LVAYLGPSVIARPVDELENHHATQWSADFEALYVVLRALHRNLLAVPLQLQNPQRGGFGFLSKGNGLFETFDVVARSRGSRFVLQLVDFSEGRTLLELEIGLGQIGLRLAHIGRPPFAARSVFREFLVYLMT
jgi:hypothetical protein